MKSVPNLANPENSTTRLLLCLLTTTRELDHSCMPLMRSKSRNQVEGVFFLKSGPGFSAFLYIFHQYEL